MKKRRLLSLVLAAVMALSLLTGCQSGNNGSNANTAGDSGSGDAETLGSGTLNLVYSEDIDTLNPHMERSSADAEIIWSVGGVLYRIAPGTDTPYEIVPEYADGKPEMVDEEGLVWRIKVRDDAKWADGSALTAEDFAYSLKMLYDPLLLNAPGTTLDEYGVYIVNSTEYMTQAADGTTVAWEDVGVKVADGNALELTLEKAASASQVEMAFSSCITVPVKEELYEAGIVTGITDTTFGPDNTMRRCDFVLMLYRAAGQPQVSAASGFTDVPADAYYASAVAWAKAEGITTGTSDTTFSPEATLTRQEGFTFLYRAFGSLGVVYDVGDVTLLEGYSDGAAVADWAREAAATLISMGIVQGDGSGLSPAAGLTRAEMAKMLATAITKGTSSPS